MGTLGSHLQRVSRLGGARSDSEDMATEQRYPGEDSLQEAKELGLDEGIDPPAVRRQVEFYFSDSNLPRDSYVYSQHLSWTTKTILLLTIFYTLHWDGTSSHSLHRIVFLDPIEWNSSVLPSYSSWVCTVILSCCHGFNALLQVPSQ